MNAFVIIQLHAPGFHLWPSAPSETSFLRERHRHLFKFVVEFMVSSAKIGQDDNRQIEFFEAQRMVSDALKALWGRSPHEFGALSCERIASDLHEQLRGIHAFLPCAIEVWEDGENGARLTW